MSIPKKPRLETAMTFILPEQVNVEQSSHMILMHFLEKQAAP